MQNSSAILVAGKSGQLARCLVGLARSRKIPLVAAGRPELDIDDAESVERVVSAVAPNAVVNAAAYTAVDKAESEPDRAFAINRDGAARLASAAGRRRIPFIHVSTDYVFDGCKSTPYTETDIACPLGAYGRSKLAGELAVLDAHPDALVLRTSWLYSAYGQNFLNTMLRLAQTTDVVRVVDDQHGAPTSACDLTGAILDLVAALTAPAAGNRGGIYHLAAGGATTWHGFAAAIFAGWQQRQHCVPTLRPVSTADYPTPARRPANSLLDCGKIRRAFGISLPLWSRSLNICLDQVAAARAEMSS
jgi:dTDP-4-dehydrorhamnose reductase